MNSVRVWLMAHRFAVRVTVLIVIVAVILVASLIIFGRKEVLEAAPAVAIFIAVLSLFTAAAGAVATWQRQKREATIKAWNEWSDTRLKSRKLTTKFFGTGKLRHEQAKALVNEGMVLRGKDGTAADPEERADIGTAVVDILNGLERVAAGVNLGVYDVKTLKALGGSTLVATFERFRPYIDARRNAEDEDHRQANAYVELEWLVAEVDRGNLMRQRRALDQARLKRVQARR